MKIKAILQLIVLLVIYEKYACSIRPPHIIIIIVDDLGWNDVSFHGSTQIPTVNIDALAYTGIILNNYYVQPICTPSRGCMMTGKYAIRLGLHHNVIAASEPWGLNPDEVILSQRLKKLGYATHGVGKWHLGFFRKDYLPSNRGFDSFFGYWTGKDDHFTHCSAFENTNGLDFHDNENNAWNYTGYYATEVFTDRAKNIIQNHNSSKPLFLYMAHQVVHAGNSYSPLQAPKYYTDFFPHIKDNDRRTFAGMGLAMDKSVGEIFSALDKADMLQNSIIIFTTDNGAAVQGIDASTGSNWPHRGSKYNMWEGGIRGNAFIWSSSLLGPSKGSIFNNLMHITDWLPTLYSAAGGDVKELGNIDGFDFWPCFLNNSCSPRDHILHNIDPIWEVEAIRKGQYKLLKGSVFNGSFDGWFSKEGKRKTNDTEEEDESIGPEEYRKLLKESKVLQILSSEKYAAEFDFDKLNKNVKDEYCVSTNQEVKDCTSNSQMKNLVRDTLVNSASPVKVECGKRPPDSYTNCQPLKEYCLFDIMKDPCEYQNIVDRQPQVFKELKDLLDKYRKEMVPLRNKPIDPMANPKFHNYVWVPWINGPVQN